MEKAEKYGSGGKRLLRLAAPFLGLLFFIILFTLWSEGSFLSAANIERILNQGFPYIVVSLGAAFV